MLHGGHGSFIPEMVMVLNIRPLQANNIGIDPFPVDIVGSQV